MKLILTFMIFTFCSSFIVFAGLENSSNHKELSQAVERRCAQVRGGDIFPLESISRFVAMIQKKEAAYKLKFLFELLDSCKRSEDNNCFITLLKAMVVTTKDGVISLCNPIDQKFLQAFYEDLMFSDYLRECRSMDPNIVLRSCEE